MNNCPHEAWDFGALQCPDCGAVKDHVTDAEYAKLAAEAQAVREEVAALRARVVVVPERKLLNAGVPGLNRNSGWNACLDELARLNGMTVSEGLLRSACFGDEQEAAKALNVLRALLSEQEGVTP
ncbi:hypothetical protein [Pseudomonas aeruginosa]|uniref:hypothetical protein n=1 Tax=Pseudomonas aeruginosa TaxID=287 RepID=UPI0009F9A1C1|nr:hypothetical protein [Pseudomonas aeruginosa]ORE25359.1 hypothetical protein BKN47_29000 [Pseudomonas aeruginosa]